MAGIELQKIVKRYSDFTAIHELSLKIKDGEFVVFVGPSGCGKSTLLRMIAGLESITSGNLLFDGTFTNSVAPGQRGISMVFQNYALYPHMTVWDNMAFGLKNVGVPDAEIRKRIEHAARLLKMEHLLRRRPREMSGGQQQRVAIGRSIVRKPTAFLFDEPLSNLDAALRQEMRTEISMLHNKLKTTMIYVTHDQVEAMTMADRIVVMKDGRIEQAGSPMEIYEKPATRFVAEFIGAPKMNLMKASLNKNGNRAEINLGNSLVIPTTATATTHENQGLHVGVRPNRIQCMENGNFGVAKVKVVERLGDETLLFTERADGQNLTLKTQDFRGEVPGDIIPLHVDVSDLHIFDHNDQRVA